jgi:hypothetical protein
MCVITAVTRTISPSKMQPSRPPNLETGAIIPHFQSHRRLKGAEPERHHDYIDVKDFPKCWSDLHLTVEVEAKAKELAVLKLASELQAQKGRRHGRKEC